MAYVYPDNVREDILAMIPPDGTVIGSIGCGRAATEAVLVQAGRQVHGVDIAPEAIAVAAGRLTSARLVSPTDRAPFPPASLDGLILADVIEHLPAAWDALGQFARAVRPGGWVVISVPNMRNWVVLRDFIWRGDWPERELGIFDATHIQVMSPKRLERWCRDAGLTIERWHKRWYTDTYGEYRVIRTLDRLTLGRFRNWFLYQLQVVCRNSASGPDRGPG